MKDNITKTLFIIIGFAIGVTLCYITDKIKDTVISIEIIKSKK